MNTSQAFQSMNEPLEGLSLQVSELEALLETIHESCACNATTGTLISLAERLAHLLQSDVVALIVSCNQQAREAQS